LILGPLITPYIPQRFKATKKQTTTEDMLTTSLANLDAIYALRPDVSFDDLVPATLTPQERLRMLGMLLPVFITMTFWVPFRVLVAISGAMLLTYRAPWAVTTRRILFRSAYVRAAWRYVLSWLSGNQSIPIFVGKPLLSKKGSVEAAGKSKETPKSTSHAFLFTILENQRWWVGIDWSAALLPSERPSWCAPPSPITANPTKTANGQGQPQFVPVPPPATFPLPPTTSVILPSSSGSGFVRRTARWEWQENSEWEVIVHKEGDTVKKMRATVKSPGTEEEGKSSILGKNTGKTTLVQSPTNSSFHQPEDSSHPPVSQPTAPVPDNEFTDQEGWIYGDNKWENTAGKGGMGKVRCSFTWRLPY
jgi:hypothetical protein